MFKTIFRERQERQRRGNDTDETTSSESNTTFTGNGRNISENHRVDNIVKNIRK